MKRIILLIEILLAACLFTGSVPYGNAKEEIAVNTPEFNWENYNIITHALGGLDGYTYLNSRESFINHYDKGCRFFEVDLSQTSDGVWVCRHNWKEPMGQWEGDKKKVLSAEEFLNTPIYGKYTPMSFEDLLKLLDEYPDAFVTIDSKQYSVRNYQRPKFRCCCRCCRCNDRIIRCKCFVKCFFDQRLCPECFQIISIIISGT